jgi:crotonobetainyl-CoA:carnitine CoA-transferase CaiB-like acyl-CoA transferase
MTDKHWRALCRVLGWEDLAQDPRYARNADRLGAAAELHRLLAAALVQQPADVWLARFADAGIPAGPIYTYPDVFADPQVRHTGMLRELEHPSAGRHRVVGFPVRYADTPARLARPAPRLGEHSREILDQAGFALEEIEHLVAQGAVFAPETASATA